MRPAFLTPSLKLALIPRPRHSPTFHVQRPDALADMADHRPIMTIRARDLLFVDELPAGTVAGVTFYGAAAVAILALLHFDGVWLT